MRSRYSDRVSVIVITLLLISTIISDMHLGNIIEQEKRQQARYNLEQIRHCLDKGLTVMTEIEVFNQCITKSKTSQTGDVYVFDPITKKGIYNTSVDTPLHKKMSFTEDSLGKDSRYGDNVKYLFDDDWEWLEWIYYPEEMTKFAKNNPYIIVQGIQKDEVFARYKAIRLWIFFMIGFVSIILLSTIKITHRRQ